MAVLLGCVVLKVSFIKVDNITRLYHRPARMTANFFYNLACLIPLSIKINGTTSHIFLASISIRDGQLMFGD